MSLEDRRKINSERNDRASEFAELVGQALLSGMEAKKAGVPSALEIIRDALINRGKPVGTTGSSQPKKP